MTMADTIELDAAVFDQLSQGEARHLLDTIDSLREIQIGEIVNLPQIIVVGDQSSGKSSVLEAISRVRFPVKGDVCTRFATELVLRRTPSTSICVSIQYSSDTVRDSTALPKDFRWTSFDRDALPAIIEEATSQMGLPAGKFSKDVLRVEITGPDVYPLTLVDLPGFFHSATATQLPDMVIVNQLVESYMKQKNCIILAVVSASYNHANQKVLTEVAKHDPNRERTLGIITKPDRVQGASQEHTFLQLARNEEATHKLALEWHVLRNSSEEDLESKGHDRDGAEKRFFASGRWASLPIKNRGIDSLRKKLSKVLLMHIQKNLPGLIEEIESNLKTREEELGRLGKSRSNADDIREYLADITYEYQRLARDAIHGRYNDTFFGTLYDDENKLRAKLRNLNRAFDLTMTTKGASREIVWEVAEEDKAQEEAHAEMVNTKAKQIEYSIKQFEKKDEQTPEYLTPYLDLYKFPSPEPVTEAEIKDELEKLASDNQGKEFPGLPNPDLVIGFFKMHSRPWEEIASFHLDVVVEHSKIFVEQLLTHVIGSDGTTLSSILYTFVDPFFDGKETLLKEKLKEIIRPYVDGYVLPLETEFHDRLSKRAIHRIIDRISDLLRDAPPPDDEQAEADKMHRIKLLKSLVDDETSASNKFGAEKVIDMTMSYYEMSRRTFTENVINLAIESCLLSDLPDILTPRAIYRMDEETVRELAAESEDVQADRKRLESQIKALGEGLRKCQRCRARMKSVFSPRHGSSSSFSLSSPDPERQPCTPDAATPDSNHPFGWTFPPPGEPSSSSSSGADVETPGPETPKPKDAAANSYAGGSFSTLSQGLLDLLPSSSSDQSSSRTAPNTPSNSTDKDAGESPGTSFPPFTAHTETDPNGAGAGVSALQTLQNVGGQDRYRGWSMEELRLTDYAQDRRFGEESKGNIFGSMLGFGGSSQNTNSTSDYNDKIEIEAVDSDGQGSRH